MMLLCLPFQAILPENSTMMSDNGLFKGSPCGPQQRPSWIELAPVVDYYLPQEEGAIDDVCEIIDLTSSFIVLEDS